VRSERSQGQRRLVYFPFLPLRSTPPPPLVVLARCMLHWVLCLTAARGLPWCCCGWWWWWWLRAQEVLGIAKHVLRPSHSFVDCVGEDEPETNVQVGRSCNRQTCQGGGASALCPQSVLVGRMIAVAIAVTGQAPTSVVAPLGDPPPPRTHVRTYVHNPPQVYQEYLVVPSLSLVPALARVLAHCAASDPAYKVIVFFPTARFTGYMASIMGDASLGGLGMNVLEIHSRKSQSARNKVCG
jgi:hypothetical protein